ncbi:NAD-dependent epimerase/dehydratase family protein [Nannocystaceae bacterium ST9]
MLVTGASGFIGRAMLAGLHERGARVRAIARRVEPSDADVEWIACDLSREPDWSALLEGVDLVVHLAGQTSVREAERDPEADARINVAPMLGLLAAARRLADPPTVLMAGTETSAGLHRGVLDDAIVDAPLTHYDAHKRLAELALAEAVGEGRVRGASLRLTTVYGPGPRPRADDRGVIDLMITRALAGRALSVYGSGEQQRDFVFVDDVVAAFVAAALHVDALAGDHYVIGSGRGLAIRAAFEQIADEIERATGMRVPVVEVPPPADASPIDARSVVADSSRFSARTSWTPRVDFDEGLRRTIASRLALTPPRARP